MLFTCAEPDRRLSSILCPWTLRGVLARRRLRKLKCALDVDHNILRNIIGIAQRENCLLRRPRCPSVGLKTLRIAAHPVRVNERCRVCARPLCAFGNAIPVGLREKRRRDVHLLELSSSAEVVSNLRGKIIGRISHETVRLLRVNHSVKHERIEREECTSANHMVVGVRVAISNPALSARSNAGKVVIIASAPDRIRITQPERRRISTGREIHVEIRFFSAQFSYQMNRSVKVAIEWTALKRVGRFTRPVELELIDAIISDHVHARIAEALVVHRTR